MPGEFDIIREYFQRNGKAEGLVTGIGDDGAVIRPAPGRDLVVVTDTLVAGRHFPEDRAAADIGWLAMAANLSDLAAMGAEPKYAFLNLALPSADEIWLREFSAGLFELADQYSVALAGGDTTSGPLNVSVTLIGEVPEGRALLRSGAKPGDHIFVTGWPGRAAAALQCWRRGESVPADLDIAWRRPEPRVAAGVALRGLASAVIDVSDGLAADLRHILEQSSAGQYEIGAILDAEKLPLAKSLLELFGGTQARSGVLSGGDDYELCFTLPPENVPVMQAAFAALNLPVHEIGSIEEERGLRLKTTAGVETLTGQLGWDHFREMDA